MLRRFFILAAIASAALTARAPSVLALTPCNRSYPSDAAIPWDCRTIGKGETLESLFNERWRDVARFNRIDRRHAHPGMRIRVPTSLAAIEGFTPMPPRYDEATAEAKFLLLDLSEQFIGAYERGALVYSAPVATGRSSNPTPAGAFRLSAFDRKHRSSLYTVEGTNRPYPMHYGLRFLTTPSGVTYWIHGRDMPGYPASHGCIGLYDEEMQKEVYRHPKDPQLDDARRLYEWVLGDTPDPGTQQEFDGPRLVITGSLSVIGR